MLQVFMKQTHSLTLLLHKGEICDAFTFFFPDCSMQIKILELPSKTLVCTLVPDAKLGMVMCIQLFQVSITHPPDARHINYISSFYIVFDLCSAASFWFTVTTTEVDKNEH